MLIKDSTVGKICREQNSNKYLPIVDEPLGYAKLCCYTVKLLNGNDIFASYENICVALWLMFPKCEHFRLSGFDDMPDTDYMEKLIKLRSTPKNQNYLTGGKPQGRASELGSEWQLTTKGEIYAQEVHEILAEVARGMAVTKSQSSRGANYESIFKKIWQSRLWYRYQGGEGLDGTTAVEVASALDFLYSSSSFGDDLREMRQYYEREIKKVQNDGINDPRIEKTKDLLKKLGSIKVVVKNA